VSRNSILKREGARKIIQLASPADAFAFHPGLKLSKGDYETGFRAFLRRRLPWLFPRVVIVDIDVNAGIVTSEAQRWSWRRWKWETRR
jgi:hypothetical protein